MELSSTSRKYYIEIRLAKITVTCFNCLLITITWSYFCMFDLYMYGLFNFLDVHTILFWRKVCKISIYTFSFLTTCNLCGLFMLHKTFLTMWFFYVTQNFDVGRIFSVHDLSLYAWRYNIIWDKVFKSGPTKICGRQPLKLLKGYGLFKQTISLHIPSNFLKAVSHKFYLVHSWILCHICSR